MMPVSAHHRTDFVGPSFTEKTKAKLGFSIEELVGKPTKTPSPPTEDVVYQESNSPIALIKSTSPVSPPVQGFTVTASSEYCDPGMNMYDAFHSSLYAGYGPQDPGMLFPRAVFPLIGNCGASPVHSQVQSSLPIVITREPHPLYPWLLNRQTRYFPQKLQGLESSTFLFHPFRKPKRIRTAFSPSQLLQLEHAFEKNHYVVGNERRQLAQNLNLSETQVKVWFQNRRTKHKRQKQDDEQCSDSKSKSYYNPENSSSSDEDCHECQSPVRESSTSSVDQSLGKTSAFTTVCSS